MQRGVSTLVGIIIILAVATVSFGGVFIYQYYLVKTQPLPQQQEQLIGGDTDSGGCLIAAGYSWCEAKQKCLRAWEEPCEEADPQTAGWQTYTNSEYGFEIKYPNNFYENPTTAKYNPNTTDTRLGKPFELDQIKLSYHLPELNPIKTLYLDSTEYKNSGFQFAYFNIGIDQDSADFSSCQTLASGPSSSGMSQKTQLNINGETFYRYKIFDDAMGGQRGTGYVYFKVANNKCFVLHGFHAYRDARGFSDIEINFKDSEVLEISEKLNQIASTFKFTIPTGVGQCVKTAISKITTRLGAPDSGDMVIYANGIPGVSYEKIPGLKNSKIGDAVNLCLTNIPEDCPPGDERGKIYSAMNIRTGESWELPDSAHSCGGA